jgi:hypothetical protein
MDIHPIMMASNSHHSQKWIKKKIEVKTFNFLSKVQKFNLGVV